MKRLLLASVLAACLLGRVPAVGAAGGEVAGLYDALVPVASQQADERRRALNAALLEVLVKVTGEPSEQVAAALGAEAPDPVRFVRQYRYDALPGLAAGEDGAFQRLALGVEFDKGAVDRLAREVGLPLWGRVRPTTLVWLGDERGGARRLVTDDEAPEVWHALEGRARARGIPLVMPLLDIQDQTLLQPADIWGGFSEPIREASRRYGSDFILVGRLFRGASGLEESAWVLYGDDGETSWRLREGSHAQQAAAAVDRLTGRVARDFAVAGTAGAGGTVEMVVSGVRVLDHYGALMTYLEGLDAVDEVRPLSLEGTRLTLRLRAAVAREQVVRTLSLGGLLEPLATEEGLRFELAP